LQALLEADLAAAVRKWEQQRFFYPCSRWRGPRRAVALVAQQEALAAGHSGGTGGRMTGVEAAEGGAGELEQVAQRD